MVMRTRSALLAVAASTMLGTPVSAESSDEKAIRDLESRFVAAFNAKDVDAIMKVYVPGQELLVFDVVPPRQYVGADAYRKDWEDTFASFQGPVKFSVSDLDITVDGNHAYSHSIQYVSGADKKGQPLALNVRVTDVYQKINGNWLIIHEHVSVPVDLGTGAGDLLSKP
jgi:uncharacterized protein (TIGR02246 family)